MKSSLLSLRRSPSKILQAIEKRQVVTLTKRGKPLARIVPLQENKGASACSQPAFGMWQDAGSGSVDQQVRDMRKGRFRDL